MMTKADLDALRAKQSEAQARLDAAKEEASRMAGDDEVVPEELKNRAMEASAEIIKIGEEIAEGEKARTAAREEDAEFWRNVGRDVSKATKPIEPRRKQDGTLGRPGMELTRDSVDLFRQRMAMEYGSGFERDNPFVMEIDPDAERLMLDMITTPNNLMVTRAAEFDKRRRELSRHATPVSAGTALATPNNPDGAFLVPDDNSFMFEVQMAKFAHGGVVNVARTFETPDGRPLPIPTIDDTGASIAAPNRGRPTGSGIKAENAAASTVRLVFGEEEMKAYMITSGVLSATHEAMQDAGPTLPTLLGMLAAERIQRQESWHFINGTGATMPSGLANQFTETAVQKIVYDNSENRFTTAPWQAFIALKYAVDAGWRVSGRYSMVMGDQLDQYFAGAVGTDGHPIFRAWGEGNTARGAGLSYAGMNMLSDYSIAPSDLTSNGTDRAFGWVGDFNWFWIRRAAGMFMIRDPYTDAASFAVNWVFGRRCDSHGLFNTGSNPSVRRINHDVVA